MGLNSTLDTDEDTLHPILNHERRITRTEQALNEHAKDEHGTLVKELLDRLNNFQSDVFTRLDQARNEQAQYLQQLIKEALSPIEQAIDNLEQTVYEGKEKPAKKQEEKEDDSEDDNEDENDGVDMDVPDIETSPKPTDDKPRRGARARRKARRDARKEGK